MSEKNCSKCNKSKPLTDFCKDKSAKDGLFFCCRKCSSESFRSYYRTKIGVITEIYGSQKSSSKKRGHKPPEYTKTELSDWLNKQSLFHELYEKWVKSGYSKTLKPSCDRTDDYQGYNLNRLQLMTWDENRKKGRLDEINGVNNKRSKAVVKLTRNMLIVSEYYSMRQASRETGVANSDISNCCSGKNKTAGGFKWRYA